MRSPTMICRDDERRHQVRDDPVLNGLDFVEVEGRAPRSPGRPPRWTLTACFLGKAPEGLRRENVRIEGGTRIQDVEIREVQVIRNPSPDRDDCLKAIIEQSVDLSTYTLRLVDLDEEGRPTDRPMAGLDPRYDRLELSFAAGCPSDLDCRQTTVCPPEVPDEPEVSYLAKDYASFRQLILDRLALVMPDWQERHVPDVGIALVELLAYAGDQLSYYQDAVATEAYLDTARRRISVRRHARLMDYVLHQGTNARAFVTIRVTGGNLRLAPAAFFLITGYDEVAAPGTVLSVEDLPGTSPPPYEAFEPLVADPSEPLELYEVHDEIAIYTWGDRRCCLPRGATSVTLKDPAPPLRQEPKKTAPGAPDGKDEAPEEQSSATASSPPRQLHLASGDLLVLEESRSPTTGEMADADPQRRHVVRLTRVTESLDPLNGQPLLEVEWAAADALPFPLCVSAIGHPPECELLEELTVARGNVLLVDHGRRIDEELPPVPPPRRVRQECLGEGRPTTTVLEPGRFRPALRRAPLVFAQPLPVAARTAASQLLQQKAGRAHPAVRLSAGGQVWAARPDLLGSATRDRHFVAEVDGAGIAHLRFGDGELGRRPEVGTVFRAAYRVGRGRDGNVGAGAIAHLVLRQGKLSGLELTPRNPLPAAGGSGPEGLTEARRMVPSAWRSRLQRAVTADDYARLAEREFAHELQRAAATLRWTGSRQRILVAVDPRGHDEADPALLSRIRRRLRRYRRIGHEVVVAAARYVPLRVALTVCVDSDYLRGHVQAVVLEVLSNRALAGGRRGFFHPDELSFGEGLHLSRLVAAVQAVTGVEAVRVDRFERLFEGAADEIETGVLTLGPLEIARLDNDPSFPERGILELEMGGGR